MTSRSFSRRSFLKTIGAAAFTAPFVARSWAARSPSSVLRHASFGAGGMAWADLNEITKFRVVELVAVAEVDLNRTADLKKKFPRARIYQDWREMLDVEAKQIDSVNVSAPDHMHAPMCMSALQMGKHVYGQKPLTHDLREARKLAEFSSRSNKLVTQMGIQIHSTSFYKLAALLVQAGAIGRIKEVHSWVGKSWGDAEPQPSRTDPVPAGFDWDLWLGVCASRPFIGNGYYHPQNWRRRLDFGTGTLGDMGCHLFDPVFCALGLGAPISVRSEGVAPNAWNWANDSRIRWVFPGTRFTAANTVELNWYDGDQKLPAEVTALLEGDQRPGAGSIFVGTHGTLVLPHWARPMLYPDKRFKDFKFPKVESTNHWGEFVQACLGHGETSAGFNYAGPLTEAVLLGNVAARFPKTTLQWNSAKMQFDNSAADQFLSRNYRPGWSVKGLSG